MVQDGFVPVDPRLLTKFPNVWAVGDIAATGVPKAGLFAEAAAAAVAKTLIARIRGVGEPGRNPGRNLLPRVRRRPHRHGRGRLPVRSQGDRYV